MRTEFADLSKQQSLKLRRLFVASKIMVFSFDGDIPVRLGREIGSIKKRVIGEERSGGSQIQ